MLSECRRMALWWRETLRRGWGTSTGWLMTGPVPIRRNCEWDGLWILIFTRSRRQLVLDLGRVQKAWTSRRSGRGWVTHIWRRMNKQGGNIEKYADRHIYTLVGLGFTVRQQPVWGGMVYGHSIRPMPWTTAYLRRAPVESSELWARKQSLMRPLYGFPIYPDFSSTFITKGVQKLYQLFPSCNWKPKLVLRSKGLKIRPNIWKESDVLSKQLD